MRLWDSTAPHSPAVQMRVRRYPAAAMRRFVLILVMFSAVFSLGAEQQSATTHPSADAIIDYLNRTVDWYRRVQSLEQASGDSQELLLRAALTQNARQVVQLAFKFARAEESIIETEMRASGNAGGKGRDIARDADLASQRAAQIQARLQDLDQEISKASGDQLNVLYARRYELTAELNLANTQRDVLQDFAVFMTST